MPISPPVDRDGFEVAIICALPLEAECVQTTFDQVWRKKYGKAMGDYNAYTMGAIAGHNSVLAHMPEMGKVSAASVAAGLRSSFKCIRVAFIVGICGAAPFGPDDQNEIILGDVVISETLVQYDLGRQYPDMFQSKASLEASLTRPGSESRSMLAKLKVASNRLKLQHDTLLHTAALQDRVPQTKYPGPETDRLYQSSYTHRHRGDPPICAICESGPHLFCLRAAETNCDEVGCESEMLIPRKRLFEDHEGATSIANMPAPQVHFGKIGSADTVMKSAEHRDRVAEEFRLVAFEMEGAGAWDNFPNTLVIKGVCDYADSHKNKQWQYFAAANAASCLKALLNDWGLVDQATAQDSNRSIEGVTTLDPLWHVPFVTSNLPALVGRTDEIRSIESTLFRPNSPGRFAILGLGGIGKSRLALEVAERQRSTKISVFWVQARDALTLESDYNAIAKLLEIPGFNSADSDVRQLVPEYLDHHFDGEWLMILDNADDTNLWSRSGSNLGNPDDLIDCLPKGSKGSILVTTRNRQIATTLAGRHVVELQEMGFDQAKEILRNQLINSRILADAASTRELLEMLTRLPLAIVQCASYINRNHMSIKTYLELLKEPEDEVIELLSEDFNDEGRYNGDQNPIATTWLLSFNQIREQDPSAAQYLAFMACIGEKNIPRSILPKLPSKRKTEEALGILKAYSFLRLQDDDGPSAPLFDMHRLVRLAMRNWLKSHDKLKKSVVEAITHLNVIFPETTFDNQEIWVLLMPHAQTLCDSPLGFGTLERYELLLKVAQCLFDSGKPDAALTARAGVVKWCEENLGKEDEVTMAAYNHYSQSLGEKQDWEPVEFYARTAFNWYKKTHGADDLRTISCIRSLSRSLSILGRPKEAQVLCEAGLKALDRRQPDNLGGFALGYHRAHLMIGLSWTLYKQDKFQEAEDLLLDVVKRGETERDADYHWPLISSLDFLARTYMDDKRYEAAEDAFKRLIKLQYDAHREEHPITADSMSRLALIYLAQMRYEEAAELLPKVLEMRTRSQGPWHPDNALIMHNLAYVWRTQGRREEAIEMITKCIELRQKQLTPDHPDLVGSIGLLEALEAGDVNMDTEDIPMLDEAEDSAIGIRALERRESELGSWTQDSWGWERLDESPVRTVRRETPRSIPRQNKWRSFVNRVKGSR